jgi:hypothetical protein
MALCWRNTFMKRARLRSVFDAFGLSEKKRVGEPF